MASHVQPPLLEKELVDTFMGTFHGLYYEMMVGSISSGFSDLVTIGERIETGIKSGKISGGPTNAPYNSKQSASKRSASTWGTTTINDPARPAVRQKATQEI